MFSQFPVATQRVITAVTSRFFLIQPDGTIKRLNEFDRAIEWCFNQKAASLRHAARQDGVRVWDKEAAKFLSETVV